MPKAAGTTRTITVTETPENAHMLYAHCFRSGEIEISEKADVPGMICFGKGSAEDLENRLQGRARLAYDGETWLVPGVPEAEDADKALDALIDFQQRFNA